MPEDTFIPPTENLQRLTRRERCRCKGWIELPANASEKMIEEAVRRHQKTLEHRVWFDHYERTGQDW